jgi:hypothetical protein
MSVENPLTLGGRGGFSSIFRSASFVALISA